MTDNISNVAVLLAAYNGIAYIEDQLQSILLQKNVHVTVFMSIDLSTDGTYEWSCDYAQKHPNIKILPYGERFGGAAPNFYRLIRDVDFSTFDYVALSDQDDVWLEDKLDSACAYIKKSNLAAYSGNVLAFWESGKEYLINKAQPQRQFDFLFEAAGPGCTYVMQTKSLITFKGFLIAHWQQINDVALHDWLIYAYFRANGYKWFIDPVYKLRYRQHAENQVGINKGWRARFMRFKLLNNGWYRRQVVLISNLVGVCGPDFNSSIEVLSNISQLRRRWQDRIILLAVVIFDLY